MDKRKIGLWMIIGISVCIILYRIVGSLLTTGMILVVYMILRYLMIRQRKIEVGSEIKAYLEKRYGNLVVLRHVSYRWDERKYVGAAKTTDHRNIHLCIWQSYGQPKIWDNYFVATWQYEIGEYLRERLLEQWGIKARIMVTINGLYNPSSFFKQIYQSYTEENIPHWYDAKELKKNQMASIVSVMIKKVYDVGEDVESVYQIVGEVVEADFTANEIRIDYEQEDFTVSSEFERNDLADFKLDKVKESLKGDIGIWVNEPIDGEVQDEQWEFMYDIIKKYEDIPYLKTLYFMYKNYRKRDDKFEFKKEARNQVQNIADVKKFKQSRG